MLGWTSRPPGLGTCHRSWETRPGQAARFWGENTTSCEIAVLASPILGAAL
ncbi:uncharacterized protein PgNI_00482 [Pyricularia grisea]|uniref:Uncharacterized protein n=1 Tax=Pyricularia grisea TaxID=148305 RepID=A0A6P8BLW9_PYRGI|nr:uncharacterized protein PgNI_00482 [Pyricularia grisea]TLD17635.1 hypothetical protein PgNI_00482 [Pyricularia grisea]